MVSDVTFRFAAASGRGFGTVNVAPVDMCDLVEVVRAPKKVPHAPHPPFWRKKRVVKRESDTFEFN